ncbi:hypothetical protein ACMD2_16617, partial [Ananas comosus]
LPLRNKSYTWTNGRRNPTLECLDRTFISQDWLLSFPNSFLSALPRPRSDHTPLLLSAHTFVPSARIFRFESFWLQHPALSGVISQAWNSSVPSSDPLNRFASKIECVQNALKSWSSGLTSVIKEQTATCLRWLGWLDRAEEDRALTINAKLHTLQFADDMLLFFDGSTRLAAVIKLILDAFSATSGESTGAANTIPLTFRCPSIGEDDGVENLEDGEGSGVSGGLHLHGSRT